MADNEFQAMAASKAGRAALKKQLAAVRKVRLSTGKAAARSEWRTQGLPDIVQDVSNPAVD